jgi:hypothetical protein
MVNSAAPGSAQIQVPFARLRPKHCDHANNAKGRLFLVLRQGARVGGWWRCGSTNWVSASSQLVLADVSSPRMPRCGAGWPLQRQESVYLARTRTSDTASMSRHYHSNVRRGASSSSQQGCRPRVRALHSYDCIVCSRLQAMPTCRHTSPSGAWCRLSAWNLTRMGHAVCPWRKWNLARLRLTEEPRLCFIRYVHVR